MERKNKIKKLVKIDGGALGILDSPRALLKSSVASPEITSMLKDIDGDLLYCFSEDGLEDRHLHHEGNKAYEERFRKDVTQLYEESKSCSNPFIEAGE